MTSFMYFKFAILLLHLSWVGFAQDNSTHSTKGKIVSNLNMTALNLTNASSICQLRIDESAVENILRFMHNYTTHVVEINVFIDSKNETRSFPELIWPWANEIGRTIISLKARTSAIYNRNITISSLHFITLNPGIEKVNVIVSEENYGCLPTGSIGSELVFDFLLHQVSRSDDTHDYTLCRAISENELKQYNCCRVASGGKLTICTEYSSIILEYAAKYINVMGILILYVGLPLMWQFLQSVQNEREHYEITDSPMALSTIFYEVFMEGSKTPAKSICRRLAFSLTVIVIICISFSERGWIIASLVWGVIFTAYNFFGTSEDTTEIKGITKYETYVNILTLPFNIKYWWKTFKSKLPERLTQSSAEMSTNCGKQVCAMAMQLLLGLCFVLSYLLSLGIICLFVFISLPFLTILIISYAQCKRMSDRFGDHPKQPHKIIIYFLVTIWGIVFLASVVFICFFFSAFANLMLYLITGLYLNGSFYSPFVVPTLVLLAYSWKNWRSFVETKYLVLKTKIHEVCKTKKKEEENKSNTSISTTSSLRNERNHQENEENIEDTDPEYTVNVEEGRVSKALYDKIRERMLPYNVVLFSFFVRMFFVANFCLTIYVMMLLARASNIAAAAQIMTTIIVSTFPLIFDAIWADSSEQMNANGKKLEQDLDRIMKIKVKTDNMVTVEVVGEETKAADIITQINDALENAYVNDVFVSSPRDSP